MCGPQKTTQPGNRVTRLRLGKGHLTSGDHPCEPAVQSRPARLGAGAAAGGQQQRPLSPSSSPRVKAKDAFSPRNQGKAPFGSPLQPGAFPHPHDTHWLPTHRVCPHTFTISFKEGFRYLVVLHRGQPWSSIVPPFVWTP